MKNNMGFILLKKISFLFLLVSAALFSTSFAGRLSRSVVLKEDATTLDQATGSLPRHSHSHDDGKTMGEIHERLLKVKTNDYGRYDPAPALVKPPFKLIPN